MPLKTDLSLSELYAFASYSLKYPSAEVITADYLSCLHELLEEHEKSNCERTFLTNIDSPENIENLQIEYTRLFINDFPKLTSPPYESYYRSADGLLNNKTTEEVVSFYHRCGYSFQNSAELPDHITIELEFMGLLLNDGMDAEYDEFINDHFRKWFPFFKKRVIENSRHPYYKAIVELIPA
jgi:putative dimethyl sulfoxide reductase chaperone